MIHFSKVSSIIVAVVKINALMSTPKQTQSAANAEAHAFPALVESHVTADCSLYLIALI